MPARLQERFQAARDDPDLLVLRDDIAVLDARIGELLAGLDIGESETRWRTLHAALTAYDQARGTVLEATRWHMLTSAAAAGLDDYAAWHAIQDAMETRRRFIESERKRLVELGQMLTAQQAMVLLDRVVDVIKRNVSDRTALVAISNELHGLAYAPDGAHEQSL